MPNPDPTTRTIFITIYAAGLRISEVVRQTTADLNSERMVIHVRQAKGAHFLDCTPDKRCAIAGRLSSSTLTSKQGSKGRWMM